MKTPTFLLCASLLAVHAVRAATDDDANTNAPASAPAAAANGATAELGSTNNLTLNFHDAPLSMVLDYISEKAGYVIVSDEDMRQKITLESAAPVNKEELRDLLNTVLSKNGYRVTISGRTLTIKSASNASGSDIPVFNISDPAKIPYNDTIGTWVMGVHSLDPKQLIQDLEPLIPQGVKVQANEAGDAIIMTAAAKDVHHFAEILKALDSSANADVAVFLLKYADSKSVASELKEVFQSADSSVSRANRQNQGGGTRFRGFGGGGGFGGFGGGGPFGGGGGGGGNEGENKNAATEAVFTSDDLMNAVVAAAPPELMPAITNVIQQLDQPTEDVTEIHAFHLINADPTEMADEINNLFTSNTDQNNNNRGPGFQFFRPPFFGGGGGGNNNSQSDRMKRQTTVNAVADPRTDSVIVTASKTLMREIEGVIAELDKSDAHRQHVYTFDISNADPMDINTTMQTLFASQNHPQTSTTANDSPLITRMQNANTQQTGTAATSFGTQGQGGGGGTGR